MASKAKSVQSKKAASAAGSTGKKNSATTTATHSKKNGSTATGSSSKTTSGSNNAPSGPLPALLLADSFDEFFRPLTLDLPRCLLPIVNVPMINYTIESLAASGVEEIYVFCCSHADKVESHIRQFVASARLPDVNIKCVVSKDSNSVGDALRAVYQMGILSDDFLLVYGDVISNVKLSKLVQEHTLRRSKDKQLIMTLLLAPCRSMRTPALRTPNPPATLSTHNHLPEAAPAPAAAKKAAPPSHADDFEDDYASSDNNSDTSDFSHDDDFEDEEDDDEPDAMSEKASAVRRRGGDGTARRVVLLDAHSGQLLHYADSSAVSSKPSDVIEMDMTLFDNRHRLAFRHDLEEVGIAICSADVLFQFNDNFDYTNVPQFVRGVVNEEILSCRVYAYVEQTAQSYSSRASSLRRYQQVSWDILQRWTYPFTPDTNLVSCGANDANYSYVRDVRGGPGVYLQRPVHLARSAIVSGAAALSHPEVLKHTQNERLPPVPSAVGEQTHIGAGSVVFASCIGRNCRIGQNVVIICSHLWDGAEVGDGAVIVGSLLGSQTKVGTRAVVRQGSVVSSNCVIPSGYIVPPLSKICPSSCVPAAKAAGVPLKPFLENDSLRQLTSAPIPFIELVLGWEPQLVAAASAQKHVVTKSTNDLSASDNAEESGDDSTDDFAFDQSREPKKMESDGDESSDLDDTDVGKHDVSDIEKFRTEVAQTVVRAVSEGHKMETLVLEVNSLKYAYDASFLESAGSIFDGLMATIAQNLSAKTLSSLLSKWGPIFSKFLMDVEEQTEFIFRIQEFCERDGNDRFAKLFQNMLHLLYESDVLAEEAILSWATEQQESGEDQRLLSQCQKLLDWLKEADSSDDD